MSPRFVNDIGFVDIELFIDSNFVVHQAKIAGYIFLRFPYKHQHIVTHTSDNHSNRPGMPRLCASTPGAPLFLASKVVTMW